MSWEGEGYYSDITQGLIKSLDADVVMVLVLGGTRPSGFGAAMRGHLTADQVKLIPQSLREAAEMIEKDLEAYPQKAQEKAHECREQGTRDVQASAGGLREAQDRDDSSGGG
jgi:hypothetical protein